jgi:cell wall-associated NlpC family hydrolase
MRFPAWVTTYIGVPYERADCWELICKVYREQFGLTLPPAPGGDDRARGAELWQQAVNAWMVVDVDSAQLGDILVFAHPRLGWHAALVIAPGWMLHADEALNVVREEYTKHVWRNLLAGTYRHPSRQAAAGADSSLSSSI